MSQVDTMLRELKGSPRGPQIAAFFDLDGTIVDGYTAGAFYVDRLRRGDVGPQELAHSILIYADTVLLGGDASRLGEVAVAALRGQQRTALEAVGERVFREHLVGSIRDELRALVEAHQRKGHTVVIASSATRFQVDPVARDLGIEEVLCTEVAEEGGVLTGAIDGAMLWKGAKAGAVRAFAEQHGAQLARSYAYANGDEDISFLASVGNPRAVTPQPLLQHVARTEGWPVLELDRTAGASVSELVGTVVAAGAMNLSMLAAVGIGLLCGRRQTGANLAGPVAYDAALAIAGVRLRVLGREHLEAARPAVYVFNHQSNLDPIVAGALVRRDFTATGKLEARRDPASALTGHVLDAVYLDRKNPESAKQQMQTLVGRLHAGISVLIAPEGTRSATPVPGQFKHGAFHLAQQAGVPVVPLVLRNTGELMPSGSKAIRPGTVDVRVLAPVQTSGWSKADIAPQADELRGRVEQIVLNWPGHK